MLFCSSLFLLLRLPFLPLRLGPLLSGLIAFVVWPPLLLSLVMFPFPSFLRLRLGVLPLSSLLSICMIYSFPRLMGSRWVRLLLRVQFYNGFVLSCWLVLSLWFVSDGGECLVGPTRLSAIISVVLRRRMLAVGLGSRHLLSPLDRCVHGNSIIVCSLLYRLLYLW